MERAVDGVGKLMVGGDGKKYIGCLHRNLEFMEVIVLKYARVFERRFNKRLRTGFGVFLQKMFLERAGIDTDPHRTAMVACRADHFADPVSAPDIARVDPQTGRTGGGGLNGTAIVKMNIGNDRHRACRTDVMERAGAVLVWTGYTNNIGTGFRCRLDLRQRAGNVGRQRVGHRLHRYRRIATNRNRSDHDLSALPPFDGSVGAIRVGHGPCLLYWADSSVVQQIRGPMPAKPTTPD